MAKYMLLVASILLVGCATGQGGHFYRSTSDCPVNHTLTCKVSGHDRKIIRSDCVCVSNSGLKALLRRL